MVDVVQTSVPLIQVKDRRMDVNFVLADGTLLHIEFESSEPTEDDQIRYGHYDLELYNQRRQKIRRLVVYSAGIKKSTAGLDTGMDIGSVTQVQTSIYLDQNFNGDKIFQEIKIKIKEEEPLTAKDKLNIILLPMMFSKTATKSQRAWQVTKVARQIKENHLSDYLIGAMVSVNYNWIGPLEKSQIMGVLKMAQVFQDLYKEFEEKGKTEVAKELILMHLDVEQIIQATRLSREKITQLRKELEH